MPTVYSTALSKLWTLSKLQTWVDLHKAQGRISNLLSVKDKDDYWLVTYVGTHKLEGNYTPAQRKEDNYARLE